MKPAAALALFTLCCPTSAALAILLYLARTAPNGYQDDAGWHEGEPR